MIFTAILRPIVCLLLQQYPSPKCFTKLRWKMTIIYTMKNLNCTVQFWTWIYWFICGRILNIAKWQNGRPIFLICMLTVLNHKCYQCPGPAATIEWLLNDCNRAYCRGPFIYLLWRIYVIVVLRTESYWIGAPESTIGNN